MKRLITLTAIFAMLSLSCDAQTSHMTRQQLDDLHRQVILDYQNEKYNEDYRKSHMTKWERDQEKRQQEEAIAAGAAEVGAAIVGAVKEHNEYKNSVALAKANIYNEKKKNALPQFSKDIHVADSVYFDGNYKQALDLYCKCAKTNDTFNHELMDAMMISDLIDSCYAHLPSSSDKAGVANNAKARLSDYSGYTTDIKNPKYEVKAKDFYTYISRISRNDKETRIELMTYNTSCAQMKVSIDDKVTIKGKKSGKLNLTKIENIDNAPATTSIPYGAQKLQYTLIFPALSSEDDMITLTIPSNKWEFKNVVCK